MVVFKLTFPMSPTCSVNREGFFSRKNMSGCCSSESNNLPDTSSNSDMDEASSSHSSPNLYSKQSEPNYEVIDVTTQISGDQICLQGHTSHEKLKRQESPAHVEADGPQDLNIKSSHSQSSINNFGIERRNDSAESVCMVSTEEDNSNELSQPCLSIEETNHYDQSNHEYYSDGNIIDEDNFNEHVALEGDIPLDFENDGSQSLPLDNEQRDNPEGSLDLDQHMLENQAREDPHAATIGGTQVIYFSDDDNAHSGELNELLNRYVHDAKELCACSDN